MNFTNNMAAMVFLLFSRVAVQPCSYGEVFPNLNIVGILVLFFYMNLEQTTLFRPSHKNIVPLNLKSQSLTLRSLNTGNFSINDDLYHTEFVFAEIAFVVECE